MSGSPPAFSFFSRFLRPILEQRNILPTFCNLYKEDINKFCHLSASMKVIKFVLGGQLLLAACVVSIPMALDQNALEARNGMLMF